MVKNKLHFNTSNICFETDRWGTDERNRSLRKCSCRWEDNIKKDLNATAWVLNSSGSG
jgi:hypothetical protein